MRGAAGVSSLRLVNKNGTQLDRLPIASREKWEIGRWRPVRKKLYFGMYFFRVTVRLHKQTMTDRLTDVTLKWRQPTKPL